MQEHESNAAPSTAPPEAPLAVSVQGSRVGLRPARIADFSTLYSWRSDLLAFNLLHWLNEVMTFDEFADRMRAHLASSINFLVVDSRDGQPIGFVFAYDVNLVDGWCFVLVYTIKESRRKALGREEAFLFWDYLFRNFRFRKLYMDVGEFNAGWLDSAPAVEAGLFVEEGRFRQHVMQGGTTWDVRRMALNRDRWETLGPFLLRLSQAGEGTAQGGSAAREPDHTIAQGSPSGKTTYKSGPPRSKDEILELHLSYPRKGLVNEAVATLASDVVFESPVTGAVRGKSELEKLMRDRQAALERLSVSPDSGSRINWSRPVADGEDSIRIRGAVEGAGDVEVALTVDGAGRVCRYAWTGSTEAIVAYYLGSPE